MTADARSKFRRDLDRWLEIVAQVDVATARLDDLIETCSNTGFPQRNVLVNLNELKMIRDLLTAPDGGHGDECRCFLAPGCRVHDREGLLLALARADGQPWTTIAGGSRHTAEMMYGRQADAVAEWMGAST